APSTTDIYTLSLHDALPIYATVRTHPHTVGQGECLVLEAAVMTQLRRGVEAVHGDHVRAVPLPLVLQLPAQRAHAGIQNALGQRSEEHTSELQSLAYLVCRL